MQLQKKANKWFTNAASDEGQQVVHKCSFRRRPTRGSQMQLQTQVNKWFTNAASDEGQQVVHPVLCVSPTFQAFYWRGFCIV